VKVNVASIHLGQDRLLERARDSAVECRRAPRAGGANRRVLVLAPSGTHQSTLVHRRTRRIAADERLQKRSEFQTFRLQILNFHCRRRMTLSRKTPESRVGKVELELCKRLFAKNPQSRALCGDVFRDQDFYTELGLCVVDIAVKVWRAAHRSTPQIVSRKMTFSRCRLCFCPNSCGPPSHYPDPANPWQTGRHCHLGRHKSPGRRFARK
jgi:hypothetical protein